MLLALVPFFGIKLGRSRAERWLWLANGLLTFTIPYGILYWAEQWVPSGLAAVLYATYPLMIALIAHAALPDERLTLLKTSGVLVGFVVAEAIIFVPLLAIAMALQPGIVESAVGVTLLGTGGLTAVAFITRKDFSFLRSILVWGGVLALVWVAFKVGALSYGGGFVIIPLMQHDAVEVYHWMTDGQFLNAVALGQITPGPVVHTVAVVGYAAGGVGGALLASAVAFAPSFSFILIGADRFDRLRANDSVRAFLDGAGPAAIGAIAGSAIPLALALQVGWQFAILAASAVALFALRRGVVFTLVAAGAAGVAAALLGATLPH